MSDPVVSSTEVALVLLALVAPLALVAGIALFRGYSIHVRITRRDRHEDDGSGEA